MDCYLEFAHIYDKLINFDINYTEWAKFIIKLLEKYDINRNDYLDLACGTGNMTEKLKESFSTIYAVDKSSEMLSEAEKKMRSYGKKVKFICQDMSMLQLNHKFDLITCCLDSINYLTEVNVLKACFKSVYDHLKDESLFIFDMNSSYKLSKVLGNNIFTHDDDEVFYVWENNFENEILDMYLTFFIKQNERYSRFDEEHSERAYKEEFIEKLLYETGFVLLNKFDNYAFIDTNEETERILYVVKK
jgi:ubiquinone/menaquinone biosynthesis C-methylase UbiE